MPKPKSPNGAHAPAAAAQPPDLDKQPVNHVQWVQRDTLHTNDYNPNHVPVNELDLLALSILEDGWTQPLVVRRDGEIVDGEHRWTVAGRPEVFALTAGWLPVVFLDKPLADQIMATIRHNRARGVHGVRPMSAIVRSLVEAGLTPPEICKRLGMEEEEYDRLFDNSGMTIRGAAQAEFNKGWTPSRQSIPLMMNGKPRASKAKPAAGAKRGKGRPHAK